MILKKVSLGEEDPYSFQDWDLKPLLLTGEVCLIGSTIYSFLIKVGSLEFMTISFVIPPSLHLILQPSILVLCRQFHLCRFKRLSLSCFHSSHQSIALLFRQFQIVVLLELFFLFTVDSLFVSPVPLCYQRLLRWSN